MANRREDLRHIKVMNAIDAATSIKDLPSVSYNDIANLLASKEYDGKKISKEVIKPVVDSIIEYGLTSENVIYSLTNVLISYFYYNKDIDFETVKFKASNFYNDILNEGKLGHLYEEIIKNENKKKELLKQEENKRHEDTISEIRKASEISELPTISYSLIASYLASKKYFGNKISQSAFRPYIDELIKFGNPMHEDVVNSFKKVIILYAIINNKRDKIMDIYKDIINEGYIGHVLHEISLKNKKAYKIKKENNEKVHLSNLKKINNSFEEKDLPNIGIGELNKRVLNAVNSNSFKKDFKTSDINEISKCYLTNNISELLNVVNKLVLSSNVTKKEDMLYEIMGSLLNDYTINYIADEIIAIEQRRRKIYEMNHDEIMDILKDATRMYQLPSISFSTLTSYLCGNSTIIPNDNSFKSEHFKILTQLLLDGKKWEDKEVRDELKRICDLVYPGRVDAFDLLFKKLTSLPKTYYLVDEINLIKNLQKEFIKNGHSNVNVYFVENPKAPKEGGKFYNVYINRVEKLDLYQVLPLDLSSIVAPNTDIDAVEWLVGQKDKTFKKVGGIILYRDETIGDITVYRVNDGKISISPEEKAKLDTINNLDSQISIKEDRVKELDELIKTKEDELAKLIQEREAKERDRLFINKSVEQIVSSSKNKLLLLQKEIGESLSCLDEIESGFVKKIEGPKE